MFRFLYASQTVGWPWDFWTNNRTPGYHASTHIMNHHHIHGLNNPGWKDPPKWSVDPRKPELLQGLQEADLSTASPIQQQSLLAIFAGKSLLAKAGFERLLNLARTSCSAPFLLPLFMCYFMYTRLYPFVAVTLSLRSCLFRRPQMAMVGRRRSALRC